MAYVEPNYTTKKMLKAALASGTEVSVFQPGGIGTVLDGTVYLEGPHYPRPHSWYATDTVVGGKLVKVR
jgi:hypothetical protein